MTTVIFLLIFSTDASSSSCFGAFDAARLDDHPKFLSTKVPVNDRKFEPGDWLEETLHNLAGWYSWDEEVLEVRNANELSGGLTEAILLVFSLVTIR